LLVLAIVASSALVFTSRVELLKLAVIVALWAAFVAAFASVIYRRQSDVDQARARDLKMVYDLQLDREISARREYELTVESQLRRELASELRALGADEVAALREELAALRTNLEILFDADLDHRPALDTARTTGRAYSDWARYDSGSVPDARMSHVSTAAHRDDTADRTEENPIIDVPEVGVPAGGGPSGSPRQAAAEARGGYSEAYRGSHRQADDAWPPPGNGRWSSPPEPPQPYAAQDSRPQPEAPPPQPEPRPAPPPAPRPEPAAAAAGWRSAANSHDTLAADRPVDVSAVFNRPAAGPRHGRHSDPSEPAAESSIGTESPWQHSLGGQPARARHSAESPSHRSEMTATAPPSPAFTAPPSAPPSSTARHRGADPGTGTDSAGPDSQTGGQSVADLLTRLQTTSTGRRRRRRDE
jgi:hypothetical protein